MHTGTRYLLLSEQTAATLSGCSVEVSRDGSAIVVVDGEPLFRFASLAALLSQYGLVCGESALG
jgi:hypothetical protein